MTPKKAEEILRAQSEGREVYTKQYPRQAAQLGWQALHIVQTQRETYPFPEVLKLPSETETD